MPRWILNCLNCHTEFTHTEIDPKRTFADYFLEPKPEFPANGQKVECPNCKTSSVYQRYNLFYRKD
jgi:hypothetical protein